MSYSEEIGDLQKPMRGWGYHLTHRTKGDKVIWALVVLLALISMLIVAMFGWDQSESTAKDQNVFKVQERHLYDTSKTSLCPRGR